MRSPLHGSACCLTIAVDRLGIFQEAVLSSDQVLDIDPRDVTAWTNLGLCLIRLRCEHEAIACFENVRELSGFDTQRDTWGDSLLSQADVILPVFFSPEVKITDDIPPFSLLC